MKKCSHIAHMLAPLLELIASTPFVYFAMLFSLPIFLLAPKLIKISSLHILALNLIFSGKVLGISFVVYSQTFLFNISFRIFGPHGVMPKPIFPILLHGEIGEKSKLKNYCRIFQCKNTPLDRTKKIRNAQRKSDLTGEACHKRLTAEL